MHHDSPYHFHTLVREVEELTMAFAADFQLLLAAVQKLVAASQATVTACQAAKAQAASDAALIASLQGQLAAVVPPVDTSGLEAVAAQIDSVTASLPSDGTVSPGP
jgi:hypothetical protein